MRYFLIILIVFSNDIVTANNVDITDLKLVSDNAISYTLKWENSWNYDDDVPPYNHDAVWLFCKGKRLLDNKWESMHFADNGHNVDAPFEVNLSANGIGKIVKQATNGEGNVDLEMISQLQVVNILETYSEIRIFGIEMVYVQEGSFYVGDRISNNTLMTSGDSMPYYIDNELNINVGTANGNLWSLNEFPPAGNISSDFPKGFAGFYMMKYEISQQQYVDFLNTLTEQQAQNRSLSTSVISLCFSPEDHIDGERNYIKRINDVFGCDADDNGMFGDLNDGGNIACNFLNWAHFTAYLDWAGLRPMTELEYEKACRGENPSIPLEFAWGTDQIVNTIYADLSAGPEESTNDTIPANTGIANYGYCLPSGPLRCGFAAYNSEDRLKSGASYFGIMELSGNLWELCVVLSAQGIRFNGNHGDGRIDDNGLANEDNWDAINGGAGGFRGGGWNSGIQEGFRDLAVSDRFFAYLNPNTISRGTTGGRGVISKSMLE